MGVRWQSESENSMNGVGTVLSGRHRHQGFTQGLREYGSIVRPGWRRRAWPDQWPRLYPSQRQRFGLQQNASTIQVRRRTQNTLTAICPLVDGLVIGPRLFARKVQEWGQVATGLSLQEIVEVANRI